MSKVYVATVVAVFVTTSLATNLLVVGTRGPVRSDLMLRLMCRARRVRRRLKHTVDAWVVAVLEHRERQAAIYALRHLNDRDLKDIGLYRGSYGRIIHPYESRALMDALNDRRSS